MAGALPSIPGAPGAVLYVSEAVLGLSFIAYTSCAAMAAVDEPKGYLSMEQQAAAFQMTVNVEGSSGWADRLRHLLLSGMVVLPGHTRSPDRRRAPPLPGCASGAWRPFQLSVCSFRTPQRLTKQPKPLDAH